VVLARWLLTHPDYLILDEPTRGIDVGTKVEIQKLVLKLAEDGVSVTFISSEIEEMLRTCSRLIVMKDREIVGELSGRESDRKRRHARDCQGERVTMGGTGQSLRQLHISFLPLSVLGLLIVINLIKGADYFSISLINGALYGNIPNILFGASELVIISIGMTLVTASSGGQDISVGVAATIASAVFVQFVINV
jgi:energy-coupling factor transporter ATP-binding protein EcfA2